MVEKIYSCNQIFNENLIEREEGIWLWDEQHCDEEDQSFLG